MDNTIRFQRLGYRAYWLFFFEKSKYFVVPLLLILFLQWISRISQLSEEFLQTINDTTLALLSVFIIVFVGALLTSWIQYIAYEFALDEHALKIRRGILNIQIEAVPYRHMQNVDIERSILYRVFSLSRIIILTAGTEDPLSDNESEAIIPGIEKHIAHDLQQELLRRANIEKVLQVNRIREMSR